MPDASPDETVRALLRWYAEMGVDDVSGAAPADFFSWGAVQQAEKPASVSPPAQIVSIAPAPRIAADEAVKAAEAAARAADTFETLAAAVAAFEGCLLKAGARTTVFTDGVPGAELLVIGEAPGREEDLSGKPFVGRAGQLLDRMLASIGRSRSANTLISNVIFWRPPGNRTPTQIETAICRPFVERLIELTGPKALLLAGGAPLQALFSLSGIMRARGTWRDFTTASGLTVPALPMFHPAFLLRQPAHKRLAWADMLALQRRLDGSG